MTKAAERRGANSALRDFLKSEASGGILLMIAAALAMIVANSPLAEAYFHFLHMETGPVLTPKLGPMTVHLWINDALMALFFLLVGLEIKREFVDGHLATWKDRGLPIVAAAGGMIVPAMVYLAVTRDAPGLARGWAIPSATDIAFAIGVLALLGSRAPASLKLFLTTVAIVDDMGAVAIIALAYTASIGGPALLAAGVLWGTMFILNRAGVIKLWPYLLLAIGLWFAVLLSGVHATIAGVLAAIAIPIRITPAAPDAADSPLHRLEHGLHPWVAYAIVPLFGFANAGVSLAGVGLEQLLAPLPAGVALGLVLGKQIGIFASVRIAVALGIGERPAGATWLQVYGVALLCGIGFTMSLFIGGLAFADPQLVDEVKIGVLGGSLVSAFAGYLLLRVAPRYRTTSQN
ncbi:sodium/proton antiporter, NhaA family [Sphingomonas laterariae]|uniref:Na(+)/H(+) antiporter NhaA n=1 Tax=Edaphosphingomonas laterariae TaxID=861865 RepID=A0A239GNA2_9SPHN|nr:Na+/H+ antiporter NhaA [Sphingomonas laterariae]SNS70292.1 sodium/proton antiporter, NhaA family [Sphingomonas laterariae]